MNSADVQVLIAEASDAGLQLSEPQTRFLHVASVRGTADILVGDTVGRLLEAKVSGNGLTPILAELRSPAALLGTAGSLVAILLVLAEAVAHQQVIDQGVVTRELQEEAEALIELPYDVSAWNDLDAHVLSRLGFDTRTDTAARLFAEALSLLAAALAIHATASSRSGHVAVGFDEHGFTWSSETYAPADMPREAFRAALRLL